MKSEEENSPENPCGRAFLKNGRVFMNIFPVRRLLVEKPFGRPTFGRSNVSAETDMTCHLSKVIGVSGNDLDQLNN
jgi:hypothetical protein